MGCGRQKAERSFGTHRKTRRWGRHELPCIGYRRCCRRRGSFDTCRTLVVLIQQKVHVAPHEKRLCATQACSMGRVSSGRHEHYAFVRLEFPNHVLQVRRSSCYRANSKPCNIIRSDYSCTAVARAYKIKSTNLDNPVWLEGPSLGSDRSFYSHGMDRVHRTVS